MRQIEVARFCCVAMPNQEAPVIGNAFVAYVGRQFRIGTQRQDIVDTPALGEVGPMAPDRRQPGFTDFAYVRLRPILLIQNARAL